MGPNQRIETPPGGASSEDRSYPTDWSFYVETTSTTTLYNLGCNQGHFDANNGKSNSAVVLDFGAQNSANTGTTEINGVGISYGTVESLAEQFARGYFICTGADTTSLQSLGVGTNNSAYQVSIS